MKVVIKKPFEKPVVTEIEKGLKPLQKLVGGLIDNLDPNFLVFGGNDIVVGTAVFTGCDNEGGDISLTDEQITIIKDYLSKRSL